LSNQVIRQKDKVGNIYYNEEIPYTTKEQKVGTWIDGKPLYRKVIINEQVVLEASKATDLEVISNIDNIVKIECYCKFPSAWVTIPFQSLSSNKYDISYIQNQYITITVPEGNIKIYSQFGTNATQKQTVSKVITILNYTKTTD
jgi:hypothetical protein